MFVCAAAAPALQTDAKTHMVSDGQPTQATHGPTPLARIVPAHYQRELVDWVQLIQTDAGNVHARVMLGPGLARAALYNPHR